MLIEFVPFEKILTCSMWYWGRPTWADGYDDFVRICKLSNSLDQFKLILIE